MKIPICFLVVFFSVSGQTLDEIWIQTKNSGDVDATNTQNVHNYYTFDATNTQNVHDYYTSLSSYHLFPTKKRFVNFKVKACHDAFILLSAAVDLNSPDFYEICLGASFGKAYTFLRRKYNTGEIVDTLTPGVLNCTAYMTLVLNWSVDGRINLTKYANTGTENVIDYTDTIPLQIQGVGIRTGWGAEGMWILEHVPFFTGSFCGVSRAYGNMTLLNNEIQPSKITCLCECAMNDACLGVNFNTISSECQLVAGQQIIVKSTVDDWVFYTKCLAEDKMCLACLNI